MGRGSTDGGWTIAGRILASVLLALVLLGIPLAHASAPPVVTITASPSSPRTGESVSFQSTVVHDGSTTESWDFGDGATATGATASHGYAAAGSYTVVLTSTPDDGSGPSTATTTVTVENRAPDASFTFSPASPETGQAVTFSSTSSDPDGSVASQAWDTDNDGVFDDGTGPQASRTFGQPGDYTVRLQVTDNNGSTDVASRTVRVANQPPLASFTYSPSPFTSGQTVTFRSTSSDPEGAIVSQSWDFNNDGQFGDRTGATVSWSFLTTRPYTVRLRVEDSAGAVDVETSVVTPGNRAPVVSIAFAPAQPQAGALVTFTGSASDPDGTISSRAWDVDGDGDFDDATGPTATVAFPAAGTYTVRMRAIDNDDASSIAIATVVVSAAPAGSSPVAAQGVLGTTAAGPVSFALLKPFPVIRIRGWVTARGARISLLSVRAPRGSRVSVRCRGVRCPLRRQVRSAGRVRLKRLQRYFRAGVSIEIRVTKGQAIGKFTRIAIRKGKRPFRRDLCLVPGAKRPTKCPPA